MKQKEFLQLLKEPKLYGLDVEKINIFQTHISHVILTGKYAYKIKKPVNFGFLDFSTLEKRRQFCEEELRLNKRLCPDLYLEVVPITQQNHQLQLNGDGPVVEYAVKMKEFPQDTIMTNKLRNGKISYRHIEALCSLLVDFYNKDKPSDEINQFGELSAVKQNIDENFDQTVSVIETTIKKDIYKYIQNVNNEFFTKKPHLFSNRIQNNHIHDCHGDLHSGNIVITNNNDICIFDCIEFNKRFRYCDAASDLAFLAMDLDYLNHPYLSSHLIHTYIQQSNDSNILTMLNFYKSYRAYVRGKVLGFRLPETKGNEQQKIITNAQKYFQLAYYYAKLINLQLKQHKPLLILTAGMIGTGKSTIAQKLAIDYNATIISTDLIRKQLAGIDRYQQQHNDYNTGLYKPENIHNTYEHVLKQARQNLQKQHNVIIDATFHNQQHRTTAEQLAAQTNANLLIIYCTCPEPIIQKRLQERLKKKSISDGRWEIYLKQKPTYQPFKQIKNLIEFDTSQNTYTYQTNLFFKILTILEEETIP